MSRQAVEASAPASILPPLLCVLRQLRFAPETTRLGGETRQGEGLSARREALRQQKGLALMSTIPLLKTRGKNYTGLGAADKQAAGTGREISFFYYLVLLQVTTLSASA